MALDEIEPPRQPRAPVFENMVKVFKGHNECRAFADMERGVFVPELFEKAAFVAELDQLASPFVLIKGLAEIRHSCCPPVAFHQNTLCLSSKT